MGFVTDRIGVRPCCGNEEIQWLHTRIAGTFGHYVEKLTIRLRMQLIKYHTMNIEAMLGICLSGENLIEAVGGLKDHPLLRCKDFHPLVKCGAHPYHIGGNLKNYTGLLAVCGKLTVVGRYEGLTCKVTMTCAVHLDTLHWNLFCQWLDICQIMKTGASLLYPLPFPAEFPIKL